MRLRGQTAKIEGGFVLFPKQAHWLEAYLVHQAVIWYAGNRGRFSTIGGICCKSIAVILWISVIGRWCCLSSILTHDWQQSGWVNRKETHGSLTLGIKARRPDETRTTADPINVQASPS